MKQGTLKDWIKRFAIAGAVTLAFLALGGMTDRESVNQASTTFFQR